MQLLLEILITWRISHLIIHEEGPFAIFARWRDWVGVKYDLHNRAYSQNELGKLFTCLYCASVWVGIVIAKGDVLRGLALSAGAIFIHEKRN